MGVERYEEKAYETVEDAAKAVYEEVARYRFDDVKHGAVPFPIGVMGNCVEANVDSMCRSWSHRICTDPPFGPALHPPSLSAGLAVFGRIVSQASRSSAAAVAGPSRGACRNQG